MRNTKWWGMALAGAMLLGSTGSAEAGVFRRRCAPQCAPPPCAAPACMASCATVSGHYEDVVVQRTVYVRETSTEARAVRVTECRPEVRERTYNVCNRVPYKETVTEAYTVMVQKTQMRRVTETVYQRVVRTVDQPYTVMVPHVERRQGVQHVVQCVPVQMTRTVCVDRGCWETRQVQIPCGGYGYGGYAGYGPRGGCGGCAPGYAPCGARAPQYVTRCVRVWVPRIEHQQVAYTVMKQNVVAKPYEFDVTVCRPETRVRQVQVCEAVPTQVTKEVPFVTCVPEQKTRTFEVTRYKDVPATMVQKYTVMVPYQVEKTIQVPVCRTVPKTVQQVVRRWVVDQAPACAPAGCAAPLGGQVVEPSSPNDAHPLPTPAPGQKPAMKPKPPGPQPMK